MSIVLEKMKSEYKCMLLKMYECFISTFTRYFMACLEMIFKVIQYFARVSDHPRLYCSMHILNENELKNERKTY